jgi:hypothetical protein
MNRYRAGLIHLGISATVAVALFLVFWFVLYPAPLFHAVGGYEIFLLLLGVDVVLGPVLTTVVFNPQKRSLKADLAIIAFIQLAALIYGSYTLYSGRPAYVAALGHRFDVVQASDVPDGALETANQSLPLWGPRWVGTAASKDPKVNEKILFAAAGGRDRGHFPEAHTSLESMRAQILRESEGLPELKKYNPGRAVEIDVWLAKHKIAADAFVFQPLKARSEDMAVLMDAKTAAVIAIAPFRPWQK